MTFNKKKARDICERIKGYADPDGGNYADFAAAEMLPDALDRIEELEAAPSWQITKERKAALKFAIAMLPGDTARIYQKELIAMLAEAEGKR